MEKQFCTYKVSAELKEVGFDEECIALYTTDNYGGSVDKPALISVGGKWGSSVSCQSINYSDCRLEHNELTAPLWQQAFDWLFENHGVLIYPYLSPDKELFWVMKSDYEEFLKTKEEAVLKAIEEIKNK